MLVLNPAALADYPATFVASTYAPNREVMLEVVRRFPSITVIDLESVLEQVRSHHGPRGTRDSVRVFLLAVHLYIRFIDAVGLVSPPKVWPTTLVQLG